MTTDSLRDYGCGAGVLPDRRSWVLDAVISLDAVGVDLSVRLPARRVADVAGDGAAADGDDAVLDA
jgi:hypothetical protein